MTNTPTTENMSSEQKSIQLIMSRSERAPQFSKVLPGKLYFRRLGSIYVCDDNDLNRKALEVQGMRILPYKVGGIVGNAVSSNSVVANAMSWSKQTGSLAKNAVSDIFEVGKVYRAP